MALSVRELPNPEPSYWGTLAEPRPLELNMSEALTSSGPDDGGRGWPFATTVLRTTLGFEAMPSTDFWLFKLERETFLRAERITADPFGVHVAVALVNAITNRRVESLVHSQDGIGPEVLLPAGTYKLVVALGVANVISKVEIRLHATTKRIRMQGVAFGANYGSLLWKVVFLRGVALGSGRGYLLDMRRRVLVGVATGGSVSAARFLSRRIVGVAWGYGSTVAHFALPVVGIAAGVGAAGGSMRLAQWRMLGLAWGASGAVWLSKREPRKLVGESLNAAAATLGKRTRLRDGLERQLLDAQESLVGRRLRRGSEALDPALQAIDRIAPISLRGIAAGGTPGVAGGAPATRFINEPADPWTTRVASDGATEINTAYVTPPQV